MSRLGSAGDPTGITPDGGPGDASAARPAAAGGNGLRAVLDTLVDSMRAVAAAEDLDSLLRVATEELVRTRAVSLAWIGADRDGDGWLEGLARAGTGLGFADALRIAITDVPEGHGPAGEAVRSGRPFISTDIGADPRMAPWRDGCLAEGFRSSASFPLHSRTLPAGVVSLYAPVADAFGIDEMAILEGLARAIGLAADAVADRTARAAAEREMQSRSARLLEAFGTIGDAVIVLRAARVAGVIVDEVIEFANRTWREKILGDPDAPDPSGSRLLERFPAFADRFALHCAVIETGRPYRATMVAPLEGGTGWFDTGYVPFGDGLISVSRDVTAAIETEAAAHDFGNVLTGIRIFQGFLQESIPAEDPRSGDVRAIGDAVERGLELTRQLLAVGREAADTRPTVVDPAGMLNEMASTLRAVAAPCLLTLDTPASGAVHITRRALERAVLNLVLNARDAMAGGPGSITISLATERLTTRSALQVPGGEYVRISVRDTGPGMSAEVRGRAMEPFFTTRAHGTGIGLPSVHGTVHEAGGAVRIESEEGVGTTVSLLIPRLGAATQPG